MRVQSFSRQIPVKRFGKEHPLVGARVSFQSFHLPPSIPRGCARPDGDVSIAGGLPLRGFEGALLKLLVAARGTGISPSPRPSPGRGTGSFPLLHFLLPPGEENRGKGLHRETELMASRGRSGRRFHSSPSGKARRIPPAECRSARTRVCSRGSPRRRRPSPSSA